MVPLSLLRSVVPFVVAACVLLALGALRAMLRWRAVPSGSWLLVELSGSIADVAPARPWWRRWTGPRASPSIAEVGRVLARAASDPRIAGVLLRLGEVSLRWASAESLRDAVLAARARGRRVVAHLPWGAGNQALLVAASCDQAYASPPSSLGPLGVSLGSSFVRGLLRKVGVEPEVLSRREFKSAAETFTREGMSAENRLQTEALADALHRALVDALVEGRKLSREAAIALVDAGPLRAREAHARGALDGALYDDELLARLSEGARAEALDHEGLVRLVSFETYARVRAPASGGRGPRVAVVDVQGPIAVAARGPGAERVTDVARVTAELRACGRDRSIGAVVLRVDSPGGSALASDLIAREVEKLRERKPVVAHFSNVAASGGYYVAALAHRIVAQPTSITGSIGVIALRFVVRDAAERVGVTHESVLRGAHAELFSPYRTWTDEERACVDRSIDAVYEDFLAVVARGRGMDRDRVESLARGRVYAARDALSLGLVDELGDLRRAVAIAAERAGIDPARDPVRVRAKGKRAAPLGSSPAAATLEALSDEALGAEALGWLAWTRSLGREVALVIEPGALGVRP
jgi:protease-4